ncbi:MAG: hypothetical protein JJU45_05010 [Acidimicrobiia bacterium]|nr:hypothetical protein [Acidimicrobiia bacterium]
MTGDIDERGRAAAQAVHEAMADVAVPETPLAPSAGGGARRVALLAAACALVALGAVGLVLATGNDEGGSDMATDAEGAIPRLLLDPVPGDLEVTGVVEFPLPEHDGIEGEIWLYGDPDAADPLAAPHVGVSVLRGIDGDDLLGDLAEAVHEDGQEPRMVATTGGVAGVITLFDGVANLMVDLGGGTMVAIRGSDTDDDDLVAVADALAMADGDVDLPPSLPGRYEVLASQPFPNGGAGMLGSLILAGDGPGYGLGYQGSAHTTFVLNAIDADDDDLLLSRWMLGATEPIEVRGTTGWLATPYPDAHWVIWRETPTALMGVQSTLGEAETLAGIESLRPASAAEWAALPRSRAADGSFAGPDDAIAGSVADGDLWWSVHLASPDELCVEVHDGTGSRATCTAGHDEHLVAGSEAVGEDTHVLYGVAWFAADDVRILAEGAEVDLEVRPTASIGLLFAVAVDATEEFPTAVVVEDVATGEVLARVPVGRDGGAAGPGTTTVSGSGDGG